MSATEILSGMIRIAAIVFAVTGVWTKDTPWLLFALFLWLAMDTSEKMERNDLQARTGA